MRKLARRTSILSAVLALAVLASACASGPSTEQKMDVVQATLEARASDLADEVDSYEFNGVNVGWDYLDSTGNRTWALAEIVTATCWGAYETGSEDGAMRKLEREMAPTIRYQNDTLVLVFLGTWILDELCNDYAA